MEQDKQDMEHEREEGNRVSKKIHSNTHTQLHPQTHQIELRLMGNPGLCRGE